MNDMISLVHKHINKRLDKSQNELTLKQNRSLHIKQMNFGQMLINNNSTFNYYKGQFSIIIKSRNTASFSSSFRTQLANAKIITSV